MFRNTLTMVYILLYRCGQACSEVILGNLFALCNSQNEGIIFQSCIHTTPLLSIYLYSCDGGFWSKLLKLSSVSLMLQEFSMFSVLPQMGN